MYFGVLCCLCLEVFFVCLEVVCKIGSCLKEGCIVRRRQKSCEENGRKHSRNNQSHVSVKYSNSDIEKR
jgi:hypothetical protein